MYASLWTWIGSPPSQVSFVIWAPITANYIQEALTTAWAALPVWLRPSLLIGEGWRGELVLGRRAVQNLTDGRGVTGVEFDTGQRISAACLHRDVEL
jgi:hypothetical protein